MMHLPNIALVCLCTSLLCNAQIFTSNGVVRNQLKTIFQDIRDELRIKRFILVTLDQPTRKRRNIINATTVLNDVLISAASILPTSVENYSPETIYKRGLLVVSLAEHINNKKPLMFRASGDSLLTFIIEVESSANLTSKIDKIPLLFHFMSLSTFPNILLLLFTKEEKLNITEIFETMFRENIVDIVILEIVSINRKPNTHDIIVHSYNPYTKIHNRRRSFAEKWFPNKVRHLHKFQIVTSTIPNHKYNDISDQISVIRFYGLIKYLNASFRQTDRFASRMNIGNKHIVLIREELFDDLLLSGMTKSNTMYTYFISVPTTYDVLHHNKLLYIIIINLSIIFLVWAAAMLMGFNYHTWHPVAIFGMILGQSNARLPVSMTEKFFFLLIIVVGLLYNSDIYSDIEESIVPIAVERKIVSFDDLNELNLTHYISVNNKINYGVRTVINLIGRAYSSKSRMNLNNDVNGSFLTYEFETQYGGYERPKCWKYQIYYKNVSCEVTSEYIDPYSRVMKSVHDWKEKGRMTDLYYTSSPMAHRILEHSPLYHQISDYFWRYTEIGLDAKELNIFTRNQVKLAEKIQRETDIHESDDEESIPLEYYLYILTVGISFALLVLGIEIVTAKYLDSCAKEMPDTARYYVTI